VFFNSCKERKSFEFKEKEIIVTSIDLLDQLGIYTIDAKVLNYNSDYFILDRSQNKVFRVNKDFTVSKKSFDTENSQLGDYEIFTFDIVKDRLFLKSKIGYTVFNLENDKFVSVYRNPFPLSQQFLEGKLGLYSTRFGNNGLEVIQFDWNDEHGFQKVNTIVQIPKSRNVLSIDQSGWLFFINKALVYVDEWSGEFYFIDIKKKKIIKNGRLPFSGPIDENYEFDENGVAFGTYKNAYSVSSNDESTFFVIREIDWEVSDSVEIDLDKEEDRKRIRRRVHHFNSDLEIIDSFALNDYANCIHFYDGKLFVNHSGEEKLYVYEFR
jgi:hypothetical protein